MSGRARAARAIIRSSRRRRMSSSRRRRHAPRSSSSRPWGSIRAVVAVTLHSRLPHRRSGLRQRLRPSGDVRAARRARAGRGGAHRWRTIGHTCPGRAARPSGRRSRVGRVGAQRRGHSKSRLHAAEKDARCRDGDHRACLRRAASLHLFHGHFTGRTGGADGGAAVPRRLRRGLGESADYEVVARWNRRREELSAFHQTPH